MSNSIGKRIRELRKERSWTQAFLAVRTNLSDREIRRIESGEVTPSAETVLALAQAFDIDSSKLTAPADQPPPRPQATSRLIHPRDGLELLNAMRHSHQYAFSPQPTDDKAVSSVIKKILRFLEWGEIWDEIPAEEKYRVGEELTVHLREFDALGWTVFIELKAGNFTFRSYEGEKTIPNWRTSTLYLVSRQSLGQVKKETPPPEASPQSEFDFVKL
jgi:transcriptional regulator with XRE-family HTH domain